MSFSAASGFDDLYDAVIGADIGREPGLLAEHRTGPWRNGTHARFSFC